ncbi:hypothetical protein [Streptomyces sp. NPDC096012]|uniref:hypothetical protein n=1 Tax=Streptomyces sp. NPDC096012 TaxID=3155684 RepID=UPI00336A712C
MLSAVNADGFTETGFLIDDIVREGAMRMPAAALAMVFKLVESAGPLARWPAVTAPHLVALVRTGAPSENGHLVERPDESGGDQRAA